MDVILRSDYWAQGLPLESAFASEKTIFV